MKRPSQSLRVIAIVAAMAVGAVATAADKSTTKSVATPITKPTKKTGPPAALTKAIDELNKEFTTWAAKPDASSLRSASDYFKGTPPEDTTVDDILNALDHGMSGPPTQVAYVKWQLLSACPTKFDGTLAVKIYNDYRSAPQPLPRYTTDIKVRQQLDRRIQSLKEGQESDVEGEVAKMREAYDSANAPILEYRDDLYSHLPTTFDTLLARLQDAAVRVQAGIDTKRLAADLNAEVRSWTVVDAKPQQANALVAALHDLDKIKGGTLYTEIKFTSKKAAWTAATAKFDSKDIEATLKDYLSNPQGSSLQFKK